MCRVKGTCSIINMKQIIVSKVDDEPINTSVDECVGIRYRIAEFRNNIKIEFNFDIRNPVPTGVAFNGHQCHWDHQEPYFKDLSH